MKKKHHTFIIQYDPTPSKQMFSEFWAAVDSEQKKVQPKHLLRVDSIETIYKLMTEPRLEIFYAISEQKPRNINQLALVLNKNNANVWRDCQVLANIGLIKLKKEHNEVRPLTSYKRIIFDFPDKSVFVRDSAALILPV